MPSAKVAGYGQHHLLLQPVRTKVRDRYIEYPTNGIPTPRIIPAVSLTDKAMVCNTCILVESHIAVLTLFLLLIAGLLEFQMMLATVSYYS